MTISPHATRPFVVVAAILAGLTVPIGEARAQATDAARTYLSGAVEACHSLNTGRATFDQARTTLGLEPPDAAGMSKGLSGKTVDTLLNMTFAFKPGNAELMMCGGTVGGLNLPGAALAEHVRAAVQQQLPGQMEVRAPETSVKEHERQMIYATNDGTLLQMSFDTPDPRQPGEPLVMSFVLAWRIVPEERQPPR